MVSLRPSRCRLPPCRSRVRSSWRRLAWPRAARYRVGEDAGPASIAKGTWTIVPLNIPDPPTTYTVLVGGNSGEEPFEVTEKEETYFYSFFSTHSAFDRDIIKSNGSTRVGWKLGSDLPDKVPIWIVVRDGRGGTAWCQSELTVDR